MTCTNLVQPEFVFKVGDSFNFPMRLQTRDTSGIINGFTLDSSTQLSAELLTVKGGYICTFVVTPYDDQVLNKGWFYLSKLDTQSWPLGRVTLDVKVTIGGVSKHSLDFMFTNVNTITK